MVFEKWFWLGLFDSSYFFVGDVSYLSATFSGKSTVTIETSLPAELVRLGLFPTFDSVPNLQTINEVDLLASMIRVLSSLPRSTSQTTIGTERIDWLKNQHSRGARLTLGLPGSARTACQKWIGPRLAWWPRGIPEGRRVGLVSSRLGRKLDFRKPWFDLLRSVCARTQTLDSLLVTAGGTTTARYLERAADLFGVRVLSIQIRENREVEQWIESVFNTDCTKFPPNVDWVQVSSPLVYEQSSVDANICNIPERDRAVVAFCDELLVLSLRSHGNLDRLIRARLLSDLWPLGTVYVSLNESLLSKKLSHELLGAGAVGWMTNESAVDRSSNCVSTFSPRMSKPTRPHFIPVPTSQPWSYLTHCTRRRDAPWPGKEEKDYIDDLILQRPAADHSAVASLASILRSKKIIASSQGIRGSQRVVCFTEVSLSDIPQLRRYRAHRVRWDFEPYGICIDQDWLKQRGARSVQYGDDQTWETLATKDRPFFQLRGMRDDSERDEEWISEKEWRSLGDVDLSELPADAAFLFVSTSEEAISLDRISRWPIAVLSPP